MLVFTDALLRRVSVSVLLKTTWSADGQHVTVDHARADYVTPPQVQMTLAIVPAARIPADLFTAYSHAQILPWIIANRASPAELESIDGIDYVLFAMVFDRLTEDAKMQILIAETPDGLSGQAANGKDLNYENWHIAVIRGAFKWQSDPKFYVKVVHTQHSMPELSTVIGVLSSDLAEVDDNGQLIGNAEIDGPNVSAGDERQVNAAADSHVYAYNYLDWNKSNWGVFQNLGAGWHPDGGEKRTYLKFDLSGFASQNVGKATLKLFHYHTGGGNAVALGVHRVTNPWQEGVGTYKPATIAGPSEITWVNQPSFDPTPELGFNPGEGSNKWIELDITPLVKSWLAGEPNFGLVIKSQGPLQNKPESQYGFRSREFNELDQRPILVLSGRGTVEGRLIKSEAEIIGEREPTSVEPDSSDGEVGQQTGQEDDRPAANQAGMNRPDAGSLLADAMAMIGTAIAVNDPVMSNDLFGQAMNLLQQSAEAAAGTWMHTAN